MCWKCDHPEATIEEWIDEIRAKKDRLGWAIQYVEDDRRPFAYTIGLHEHGLPELLVTGLTPEDTVRVLNGAAQYLVDGGRPVPGHTMSIGDGPLMEIVQVEHPAAHLNMAVALYGPGIKALQLVWHDDHDHSPWCPDFCNGDARQPVLGVRFGSLSS
ncbi:DUF4262 domain-containing protein [Mycobacterium sp. M1]|uniref:DUF4262 domain-containing protein n=1 Tax=Mycolicibacter acidiphilus TaxID=2835306 RepID=A0ABS5RK09_9MYCO|nr:DUF4262 domain-containing protein [Mycolicibacter acidiphilus]MBS9533949.1 DUF4262 domain-containing protein [Mycolicibacter acidiphilus]